LRVQAEFCERVQVLVHAGHGTALGTFENF
jgi:hypothetical protein